MDYKYKPYLMMFSVVILSIFLIFAIVNTTKILYQKKQVDDQVADIEEKINYFQRRNQELTNLINQFQNPAFLEKEARKDLNLQKEGENVAIILNNDNSSDAEKDDAKTDLPNYRKWFNFIFN